MLRNRNDFAMCRTIELGMSDDASALFFRTDYAIDEKIIIITIIICFALCMDYFSDLFSLPPPPVTSSDADGFVVSLFLFLCET